ncbi:MAG: nucleotidyltransferase domain-containing protein [Candidatus Diapherotrites archaeon]|nr:nucleotidyltransferase domain-containing protein [Candidatus Diapherotrites archaeon]
MKPRQRKSHAFPKQKAEAEQAEAQNPDARFSYTFQFEPTASTMAYRRAGRKRVSLPMLAGWLDSPDPAKKLLAAKSIAKFKPQTLERNLSEGQLVRIARFGGWPKTQTQGQQALAIMYARKGPDAIWALKAMAEGPIFELRPAAADALAMIYAKIGPKAIPELKGLLESKNLFINNAAGLALFEIYSKMGADGWEEIRKMQKGEGYPIVPGGALLMQEAIEKREGITGRQKKVRERLELFPEGKERKLLLAAREPAYATPQARALLRRTALINQIAGQLEAKYGRAFIGIVVFGSASKGYFKNVSDLDFAVIAKDEAVAEEFTQIAGQYEWLRPCMSHFVNPGGKQNQAPLFAGIFFGNRKRLQNAQKKAFSSRTPEQWDITRAKIAKDETNLLKAFDRFGIKSPKEQRRYIAAAAMRVPPPYNEMKALMESRRRQKR